MQTHNSNDETPGKNDKYTTKKNNSDVNIEQNQTQQKKSRKLTQITNWNLKIISKLSELKNIEKGLLSNTLVKACQGRYDHSNNTSNPSLHMIIKFVKQMSKLGVKKIITALAENTTNMLMELTPLANQNEIKAGLKLIANSNDELENTENFNNGKEFLRSYSSKNYTLESAKLLISTKGKAQAGEEWATQELPPQLFKKAKKDFEWTDAMKKQKERRLTAEKKINQFYPWQRFLFEQLKQVSNDRTIWLVLDKNGCNGKTFFQKAVADMHVDDVLLISYSNTNNILHLAAKQKDYKIVFVNISRQTTNINLTAIETIKDGFVSSGKYQGDSFRTDPPHVVLFSNKPLCWENLTKDKWKILHITTKQEMINQNNTFQILTLSEYLWATAQKET